MIARLVNALLAIWLAFAVVFVGFVVVTLLAWHILQ
jgi:hypothetical protein